MKDNQIRNIQSSIDIKFDVINISEKIFHCIIPDSYDLAMTFCRSQEFYESPYKEIRGKRFNMVEFMHHYTKYRKESLFSYPEDWGGFNVPSHVLNELYGSEIYDFNLYDVTMSRIIKKVMESITTEEYYLIGSTGLDNVVINHEIAHGMYYTDLKYKTKVIDIVEKIPKKQINKINRELKKIGYTKEVFIDEINSYISTGYYDFFTSLNDEDNEELKPYKNKLSSLFQRTKKKLY